MLITKEQQQALIINYIKKNGANRDSCSGFMDGVEAIMELIGSIDKAWRWQDVENSKNELPTSDMMFVPIPDVEITDQRDIERLKKGFTIPKNELYSVNPDFDGVYSE